MKFIKGNTYFKFLESLNLNKLFVNSGSVFLRRVFGLGLSFFWVFLITNLYGAETYGLFALGKICLSFAGMIFGLGIDMAIVKLSATKTHYNKGVITSDFFKKSIIIVGVSAILLSVLLFFFKEKIALDVFVNAKFTDFLLVISVLFFPFLIHKTLIGFLTVREEFKKYGNYYFLFPNILIVLSILIVYYFKWPNYYLLGGYIIAYGIFGLILLGSVYNLKKEVQKIVSYKSILKLSTPMMISSSFLFISSWTDTFMLGAMVSKAELGVYNVAFKLASLALIIIATVNTVLAPKISSLFSNQNIKEIGVEVHKATKLITYVALPLVLFLILFRKPILGLFGDEFVLGEMTLVIISLGMLFNAMSGSVAQVLNMTNHQKQFRNFTIFSALTNILLNYILIPKMGIEGAAIASLISNVILNSICIIYIRKEFGFYSFFKIKL